MKVRKVFWSFLVFFLLLNTLNAAQTQVICTADGDTLVAANSTDFIVVHAIAVISTSTTSTSFYLYNEDHNILGSSDAKITVNMTGVGGPIGFIMPYNEQGWFATDNKNEALKMHNSSPQTVIVIIIYSYKKYFEQSS